MGPNAADVCYTQVPGFHDNRVQQVNSGVSAAWREIKIYYDTLRWYSLPSAV